MYYHVMLNDNVNNELESQNKINSIAETAGGRECFCRIVCVSTSSSNSDSRMHINGFDVSQALVLSW